MTRTTRPVPDHSSPKGSRSPQHSGRACSKGVAPRSQCGVLRVRSWAWMDLNHRPLPYQGSALTELSYRPVQSDIEEREDLIEGSQASRTRQTKPVRSGDARKA